jgi:hypothetical protein
MSTGKSSIFFLRILSLAMASSATFFATESVAQEVHAVAVYEGDYGGKRRQAGEHPQGTVNVRVSTTGRPVNLVLCAYEPVKWILKVDSGVRLQQVIACGYYKQVVEGAGKAPVKAEDLMSLGREPVIFPPYADSAAEVSAMVDSIRKATGSSPVTFQRQYQGKEFLVDGKRGK